MRGDFNCKETQFLGERTRLSITIINALHLFLKIPTKICPLRRALRGRHFLQKIISACQNSSQCNFKPRIKTVKLVACVALAIFWLTILPLNIHTRWRVFVKNHSKTWPKNTKLETLFISLIHSSKMQRLTYNGEDGNELINKVYLLV